MLYQRVPMDTTTVLNYVADYIKKLGSPRSLESIREDLQRGAGRKLHMVLDKHHRWAVPEGEPLSAGLVIRSIEQAGGGIVVAVLGIKGTSTAFKLRYEEGD